MKTAIKKLLKSREVNTSKFNDLLQHKGINLHPLESHIVCKAFITAHQAKHGWRTNMSGYYLHNGSSFRDKLTTCTTSDLISKAYDKVQTIMPHYIPILLKSGDTTGPRQLFHENLLKHGLILDGDMGGIQIDMCISICQNKKYAIGLFIENLTSAYLKEHGAALHSIVTNDQASNLFIASQQDGIIVDIYNPYGRSLNATKLKPLY